MFAEWREARMPVAVGTGGKTVAFRGELSANQTGLVTGVWTKVNFNTASTDTDNALTDGKFQPSVAGYYQVNGAVWDVSAPKSTRTQCAIYKNGDILSNGIAIESATVSYNSVVSDVVYLNGTTDYLELYGLVNSTGTCAFRSENDLTYLSAVLVSGGSASGDSIWTEEDGKAVYDGNVEVNGNLQNIKETANNVGAESKLTSKKADKSSSVFSNLSSAFYNSAGELPTYTQIRSTVTNSTKGSEEANIYFYGMQGGTLTEKLKITGAGQLMTPRTYIDTTTDPANLNVRSDGLLRRSTATMYSTEEVDKKLAIKDKLIEKLSARLDALEKRVK